MKQITKKDTYQHKNSEKCIATEFDFADKDIDLGTATIRGRYPEKGYCVNEQVKELIYVLAGESALISKTQKIKFKKGDAILIDKNEAYYWQAHCRVAMVCTPAWTPEQHKLLAD